MIAYRPAAGLLQIAQYIVGGAAGAARTSLNQQAQPANRRWRCTKHDDTGNKGGHIVVVGGNGHLGSAICEVAIQQGFDVKSLSRRGMPPANGSSRGGWAATVDWIQADAADPSTYRHVLEGAAGVIHTVGTLMENDAYKKALRRGETAKYNGANYESINRDTALRVAETAAEAGVGAMLFFSAASTPPGVDPRYLSTKREAERAILALEPPTRGLVFRPGFMYSEHEPATMAIGTALLGAGTAVKMLKLGPFARAVTGMAGIELDTLRPLRTVDVAAAAVTALHDESYDGIYEIHEIQRIAEAYQPH